MTRKVLLTKSHINSFTRQDGAFVKEHEDKRQTASPKKKAIVVRKPKAEEHTWESLKSHPMHSDADKEYFKDKGYEPHQVKEIWDRDHAAGHKPVQVNKNKQKFPDVVGIAGGKKPE